MDNTTQILQGNFTAPGFALTLDLPGGVDWMEVYDYTELAAATNTHYGKHYWQRGMVAGTGIGYLYGATPCLTTAALVAPNGFTLVDSSTQTLGAAVAVTNVTAANPPLVLTGATAGVTANDTIIRLINIVGGQQVSGMDFSAGAVVANTSIALAHMPQPIAATTGFYRIVNYDPIFYPRRRFVTGITAAANAVVRMSVTHDYVVGQKVRLIVPAAFGMVEANGLVGTILASDNVGTTGHNTITLDIDSTAFTAFAFPLTGAVPFTYAEVVPLGEDTAVALFLGTDILSDATINTGYNGMKLGYDATAVGAGPAGITGHAMYWRAGKSCNV